MTVDVHQHLWPVELVDRLRARQRAPYLRGWTLHLDGEAPYEVTPSDHDPFVRRDLDLAAGTTAACLSLSAPLGIESLPAAEATGLLAAWHDGASALPGHFRVWASSPDREPDLAATAALLARPHVVGLQLAATRLGSPTGWEHAAEVLALAERVGKPVLVHPGPVSPAPRAAEHDRPAWFAPVVDYVQQMHGAWWSWHAAHARSAHPGLRVVFAAAAGLAPLHSERHAMRGGSPRPVDPDVFVDTSGYGPRALDGVVRALGIDAVVHGSDRPYAEPLAVGAERTFGAAALHAIRTTNPRRLLGWTAPAQGQRTRKETPTWAYAS